MANYYVDSASGNDSRNGTAPNRAWKTLAKLNNVVFNAGDVIHLKRGSVWDVSGTMGSTGLRLVGNGTSGNPITLTAYDAGAAPEIKNSNANTYTRTITLGYEWSNQGTSGHWWVIENIKVTAGLETGFLVLSEHCIIRDCEISGCGTGIMTGEDWGGSNLYTNNYIHDLIMTVNNGSSDYGAVGMWPRRGDEISYNLFYKCLAPSLAYGTDGGMVELYGECPGVHIHHNVGILCDGILEAGGYGGASDTVEGLRVHDNVTIDCGCITLHTPASSFETTLDDIVIEHNTFVETSPEDAGYEHWRFIEWSKAAGGWNPTAGMLTFRNNIVVLTRYNRAGGAHYGTPWVSNRTSFTHTNNLFMRYAKNGATQPSLGDYVPHATEIYWQDPLFESTVDLNDSDYLDKHSLQLSANSPAIEAGVNLGYGADLLDVVRPLSGPVDIGAYQTEQQEESYQGEASLEVIVSIEATPAAGRLVFTEPGYHYFDKPKGYENVRVLVVGGGGPGGPGNGLDSGGGGGDGGAFIALVPDTYDNRDDVEIYVGQGTGQGSYYEDVGAWGAPGGGEWEPPGYEGTSGGGAAGTEWEALGGWAGWYFGWEYGNAGGDSPGEYRSGGGGGVGSPGKTGELPGYGGDGGESLYVGDAFGDDIGIAGYVGGGGGGGGSGNSPAGEGGGGGGKGASSTSPATDGVFGGGGGGGGGNVNSEPGSGGDGLVVVIWGGWMPPASTPPPTPQGLSVTSGWPEWEQFYPLWVRVDCEPSTGAAGYIVERLVDGHWEFFRDSVRPTVRLLFYSPTPGEGLHFRVTAYNAAGSSSPSASVQFTVPARAEMDIPNLEEGVEYCFYVQGGDSWKGSPPAHLTRPSEILCATPGLSELLADSTEADPPVASEPALSLKYALDSINVATGLPIAGQPALAQSHKLASASITADSPLATPSNLSQVHTLITAEISVATPIATPSSITQAHALATASGITDQPVDSEASLSQEHELLATSTATDKPVASEATVSQTHGLVTADIATGQWLATPTSISQVHTLAVVDAATALPEAEPVSIAQAHKLVGLDAATQAPLANEASLAQSHELDAEGLECDAPLAVAASIAQVHTLTTEDAHAGDVQATESALSQHHELQAADAVARVPYGDAPVLGLERDLLARNASTGVPVSTDGVLSQEHALQADSLTTDTPEASRSSMWLAAQDAVTLPAEATQPDIAQHHELESQDAVTDYAQAEKPTISTEQFIEVLNAVTGEPIASQPDISQAHTLVAVNTDTGEPCASAFALTQIHVLVAQDAVASGPVATMPTVILETMLLAEDAVTEKPEAGQPSLSQTHKLLVVGQETGLPLASKPSIVGLAELEAVSAETGVPVASAPELGMVLVSQSVEADAPVATVPSIGQIHILAADNAIAVVEVASASLAQHHMLESMDAETGPWESSSPHWSKLFVYPLQVDVEQSGTSVELDATHTLTVG